MGAVMFEVDRRALSRRVPLLETLGFHVAVRLRHLLDDDEARDAATRVRRARAEWVDDFDGDQFSLGRAWYTHLEQARASTYFAEAARGDETVERHLPGMQQRLRELVASIVRAPVVPRRSWCGPGVHVFPSRGWLAQRGGDVHFDTEGLTLAQRRARSPALTCVLMLQPAVRGGALRVWDVRYEGHDRPTAKMRRAAFVDVEYARGDAVIIDSYRLHQIQPFAGNRHRISMTIHAAKIGARWESWF